MWQIFGHDQVKDILQKQAKTAKFFHAYIFVGPEGVGKKLLALEFAKAVLNTEKLENHPDFQMLDTAEEITMEQVNGFISKIAFKPFLGAKKIAVINNAQNLNRQSSNALLKTLEEPTASTIIILISSSNGLLPTIVSRCQVFNFNSFNKTKLLEFALSQKLEAPEEALTLSFGSPAKLKKLIEQKTFFDAENDSIKQYQNIQNSNSGQKLLAVSQWAEQESESLKQNFLSWQLWQTQSLAEAPENYIKVQALSEAVGGLEKNFNKKLVLQKLFLKL